MSEHHRGAWGAREDTVWWPGAITSDQQQTLQSHHQHLLNQHHQQQLAAAQQQAVQQAQQQQQAAQQQAQQQQQQAAQQQAQQQQQQAAQQQAQQQAQQAHQQAQAAHQQAQQAQQQAQAAHDAARSTAAAAATHQLFSYKMASSFQNPATTGTVASVSSTSPVGAAGIRGYDYRLGGGMVNVGGTTLAGAAPTAQWWYPGTMENAMQNMQNVSTPPPQQNQQNQAQQQAAQQAQQQAQQQAHNQAQQLHNQQIQSQQQQQQQQQIQQQQTPRGRMPRGKADSKPRGRMTAYAFFVQTCREEHKKKHPDENVIFAEFSRKCAERWKTMLDKEKKRFHEMAEKDKQRYDAEMLNYTPPKGGENKPRGKKRKQIKDPNAPKRSLSAFFWFCNDERSKVKAVNPEYGVGDIAKELGRRWSDVEPELKSKYEAMAEQDKQRYDREMTAYKKRIKPENNVVVPEPVEEEEEEEQEEEDDE